jgi:hypothetical protein
VVVEVAQRDKISHAAQPIDSVGRRRSGGSCRGRGFACGIRGSSRGRAVKHDVKEEGSDEEDADEEWERSDEEH